MQATDFVDLVRRMRSAVKTYYKQRTQSNLRAAIDLERQVDGALEEGIEIPQDAPKQLNLFATANTEKEPYDGSTK